MALALVDLAYIQHFPCVGQFGIAVGIVYTDLYFCIVRLKRGDRSHLEDLAYWVEDLWDCDRKLYVIQLIIYILSSNHLL
jgi:hypothetical protein